MRLAPLALTAGSLVSTALACTPSTPPLETDTKAPEAGVEPKPVKEADEACTPIFSEGRINLRMLSQGSVPDTRVDLAVDLKTGFVRGTRKNGDEDVEATLDEAARRKLRAATEAVCGVPTVAGIDDSGGGFTMFQTFGDDGATPMIAMSMAGMAENEEYLTITRADWDSLVSAFPGDIVSTKGSECVQMEDTIKLRLVASSVPGTTDITLDLMSERLSGERPASGDAAAERKRVDARLDAEKVSALDTWLAGQCLDPKSTTEATYGAPGGYSHFVLTQLSGDEVFLVRENGANELPAGARYFELDAPRWDALHDLWPDL